MLSILSKTFPHKRLVLISSTFKAFWVIFKWKRLDEIQKNLLLFSDINFQLKTGYFRWTWTEFDPLNCIHSRLFPCWDAQRDFCGARTFNNWIKRENVGRKWKWGTWIFRFESFSKSPLLRCNSVMAKIPASFYLLLRGWIFLRFFSVEVFIGWSWKGGKVWLSTSFQWKPAAK